jgi:hypothetical protein
VRSHRAANPGPEAARRILSPKRRAAASVALLAFASPLSATQPESVIVGPFSSAAPGASVPNGWQALAFRHIPRHTVYELVADQGMTVLRADADASASALAKPLTLDPKVYPVLRWRWKVAKLIDKADPSKQTGDDYPARLYVTFKQDPGREGAIDRARAAVARALYGVDLPFAGLDYIWERRLPKGTIVPNAYTDHVRMIVVESGPEKVGQWVTEERNVYEDYKRAFGAEPPAISGVAVMTDGDNTQESATAWYGDISFHRAPE